MTSQVRSITKKLEVVQAYYDLYGENKAMTARKFGLPRTTINGWIKFSKYHNILLHHETTNNSASHPNGVL